MTDLRGDLAPAFTSLNLQCPLLGKNKLSISIKRKTLSTDKTLKKLLISVFWPKKLIFSCITNGRRGIDLSSLGCLFTNSRPRFIAKEHQQFPRGISDCYVRRTLNNSSYPVCIIPSSAIERYFIPCCNHQPRRSESFTFNIN